MTETAVAETAVVKLFVVERLAMKFFDRKEEIAELR